jgi:hypothetical protein
MMEIFENVAQGSPEWFACRAGIPTASKFAVVMAKGEGKTRAEYMRKLAGEILTGEPSEQFSNIHTERGRMMEDEARETYAFINAVELKRVGFIRCGNQGASPDSLLGSNGGLEVKTALPHIQIDRLQRDRLPPEHKAQVQGNLWIAQREYWDFVSYWPKLPMLQIRVYRDDAFIKTISDEVDRFNDELSALVEGIRNYQHLEQQEAA